MITHVLPDVAAPLAAHLLIHARVDIGTGGKVCASLLRRLFALHLDGPRQEERAPLNLRIDDVQGSQVFALEDAGPLVDVALPPGTYHITARRGVVRRGYTMTLPRGASVDLHLRLAADRR